MTSVAAYEKPGIYPGVPREVYDQIPGLHISRLKLVGRSPLLYKETLDNPTPPTPAMILGTAAHVSILEPDLFTERYAIWDLMTESGDMRPRRGKEWEFFQRQNEGKEIITAKDAAKIAALTAAIHGHGLAMSYLSGGDFEATLVWDDEETGRRCVGRVDMLVNQDCLISGLKTSVDCRPIPFGNRAARLGYHLQWAYYFDGYRTLAGVEPKMVEVVLEPKRPFDIACYRVGRDPLDAGRAEYRRLMKVLAECEATNEWPGAVPALEELSLPSWVYEADSDLADIGLEV